MIFSSHHICPVTRERSVSLSIYPDVRVVSRIWCSCWGRQVSRRRGLVRPLAPLQRVVLLGVLGIVCLLGLRDVLGRAGLAGVLGLVDVLGVQSFVFANDGHMSLMTSRSVTVSHLTRMGQERQE